MPLLLQSAQDRKSALKVPKAEGLSERKEISSIRSSIKVHGSKCSVKKPSWNDESILYTCGKQGKKRIGLAAHHWMLSGICVLNGATFEFFHLLPCFESQLVALMRSMTWVRRSMSSVKPYSYQCLQSRTIQHHSRDFRRKVHHSLEYLTTQVETYLKKHSRRVVAPCSWTRNFRWSGRAVSQTTGSQKWWTILSRGTEKEGLSTQRAFESQC